MIPEVVVSSLPGANIVTGSCYDYDPGVWTCSSDLHIRAMLVAKDARQEPRPHSILKHRDSSITSYTPEPEPSDEGDPDDTTRSKRAGRPSDAVCCTPSGSAKVKQEVTFSSDVIDKRPAPKTRRPWTANRGLNSHQPSLLKFRRPTSAPTILMSTGFDVDDNGEPHICSMTLYMDDYQHPGQTTKLTLSYSKSNMANARLLSTDITRHAKRRENLMQHNIKQTENRLHAQRLRREERLRQKEEEIRRLKKIEEEATQRYKLVARSVPRSKKKKEPTLLTVSEREQFRRSMIRRRTSLMPDTSANWRKFLPDAFNAEDLP